VTPPSSADGLAPQDAGKPDVTIVIIGHSVKDELEAALRSISEHAGVPVETIYVDNASNDGTRDWLRSAHPEVQLIELPENIWDAARNPGVERARGRYTMFLDSDARLTAGALPTMVAAMDDRPEWGLLAPRLVYADGTLQLSCRRFPSVLLPFWRRPPLNRLMEDSATVKRHLMEGEDHSEVRAVVYVIGACQLFRTEDGQRLGGMDESMGNAADVDLCLRFWKLGRPVVYFPTVTVEHHYQRRTASSPFSKPALNHLRYFMRLQWVYRRERRAFARLAEQLDRQGALA
jgi:GT2 family glycosyltransferase